jgi:hypothetical protein
MCLEKLNQYTNRELIMSKKTQEERERMVDVLIMNECMSLSEEASSPQVAQQPTVQQPLAQQPTVQQPLAQQPTVQQPTVQQPLAQEQQKKKREAEESVTVAQKMAQNILEEEKEEKEEKESDGDKIQFGGGLMKLKSKSGEMGNKWNEKFASI